MWVIKQSVTIFIILNEFYLLLPTKMYHLNINNINVYNSGSQSYMTTEPLEKQLFGGILQF